MTCPKCQGAMTRRPYADVTVAQCESCQGLFLDRADLGALVEAENDWHAHRSSHTQPMPRITADMTEPPPARPSSRSFLDSLFKQAR
ncbi:TFIIB-type zinc ribbon-containing protein [Nocardioides terrisoli]|uniref:TFIIB-type zinc ribbon-containing protein n=1 Tax=Nocardioides terrisoli TaxID=3388267 RepID=UPI00287BA6CA|nr:zf-TFIIB domain-containing protein [Nocardioides marmorisolisilvae]